VIMKNRSDNTRLGWVTLFASTGTLICCALPILLITLGLGSVVAAVTSHYPLLITLSEYEGWMFGISAILLGLSVWFIWGRQVQCPTEPELAARCNQARLLNQRVFWVALVIWSIGFSTRFLLLPLRNLFGL